MASRTSPKKTALTLESHGVSGLLSVAHLFPKSKGRTGVYVLNFANGESYVGQSLNVVARWQSHRRRWEDIVSTEFARARRTDLDEVERSLIRSKQACGTPLRNISFALGSDVAESDLDLVINHADQFAWLSNEEFDFAESDDEHVEDDELRLAKRANYEKLAARDDYEILIALFRLYIGATIPRPRATELTFWALSAMPGTNRSTWPRLAALSINTMETMVIGHMKAEPTAWWGFVNISRSALEESGSSLDEFLQRNPYAYTDGAGHYATSGGDAITIQFDRVYAGILDALSDEAFIHAASALNLRLMRKGPTLQWHGHCLDLADDVIADRPILKYNVPDPEQVFVTGAGTVAKHLPSVLRSFDEGFTDPVIIGQRGKPQGVVLAYAQWLEYVELAEDATGLMEKRVSEAISGRLSDGAQAVRESERAFLERIKARNPRVDEANNL
jgi:hypothetical protein